MKIPWGKDTTENEKVLYTIIFVLILALLFLK